MMGVFAPKLTISLMSPQNVSVAITRVAVVPHPLRYLFSLGSQGFVSVSVSGVRINVKAVEDEAMKTTQPDSPSLPPSAPQALPMFNLILWFLANLSFSLDDFEVCLQGANERLVLSVAELNLHCEVLGRSSGVAPQFIPRLRVLSIALAWQTPQETHRDELISVRHLQSSILLEGAEKRLYAPPTSLFDVSIERIQSNARLSAFVRLQALLLAFSPPQSSPPSSASSSNSVLAQFIVPKVRIRLPLVTARIRCLSHSLDVDADLVFNASISTVGGPVVTTGELSINATVDACPIASVSLVNPLVRLSGLHCFIQSVMSPQSSSLDLKLTTTGIIFHVVPDHARAWLSILEAVHFEPLQVRRRKVSSIELTEISAGTRKSFSTDGSRVHVSASLNSIVVELSEHRESPPVLSLRVETPSISIVGGSGTTRVIMQATFLELLALAYQTPIAETALPLSDHLINIESFSLRGDRHEVALNAKSAAFQVSPDVLNSLLPIVSALPLADIVKFRATVQKRCDEAPEEQSKPAEAVVARGETTSAVPLGVTLNLSVEVSQSVQIHIVDLRSNQETEVCVLSLLTSNVELEVNQHQDSRMPTVSLSFDKLDVAPTRYRPTVDGDPSVFAAPVFLSLTAVNFEDNELVIDDFSLQWNPELHLQSVDLVCSMLVTLIEYRQIIPRQTAATPVAPMKKSSADFDASSGPSFPQICAKLNRFQVRVLIGMHSAMLLNMDELRFTTNPTPSVEFVNAVYSAAPNHVDFQQLGTIPELKVSLRAAPRTVIGLTLFARQPHFALPYRFNFGAILDESATVFKG